VLLVVQPDELLAPGRRAGGAAGRCFHWESVRAGGESDCATAPLPVQITSAAKTAQPAMAETKVPVRVM
jgi:hypothetical protein